MYKRVFDKVDLAGIILAGLCLVMAVTICKTHTTEAPETVSLTVESSVVENAKVSIPTRESVEPIAEPVLVWVGSDEIPLTEQEQKYLYDLCIDYKVPYAYALAIMKSESEFNYEAVGSSGEVGLFQVHPVNWERMAYMDINVNTVEGNLEAGVMILSENIQRFVDLDAVTMGYKCGAGRAAELIAEGVFLDVCNEVRGLYNQFDIITSSDSYGYVWR